MTPDISLATIIADTDLPCCIYNASGPRCSTEEELHAIGESVAGAILSKSATLQKREGNEKPRYADTPWGSINSMGLPNEGYEYYAAFAAQASQYDKPYFMSVSGMSLDENVKIISDLENYEGIAGIELNLSCPNVPGKPQTGYDFEQSRHTLEAVFAVTTKPLGVKLPPYFDIPHFQMMADVLNDFPIAFVTCINSVGNGLVVDPATEGVLIKPKQGFGGIGGDFVKPTALANVRQFYTLLNKNVSIIGCGGIKSGQDAFEHILCGASAVQIGTRFMQEGTPCFERIVSELTEIMQKKNYRNIEAFKGKLKDYQS